MTTQVKLADISDALESVSMDHRAFVHLKTGEVVYMMNEYLGKAEDGEPYDHMAEWEQEVMTLALQIVDGEDCFIEVDAQDVDEYNMMESFCFTITDPTKQVGLLDAIKGKGAFRRFKDRVYHFGLIDDWYAYRDSGYKDCAKDFCDRYNLKYAGDDQVR